MSLSSLVGLLSEIAFFAGAAFSLLFVVMFNLKTATIVKDIQRAYGENGGNWPFWNDANRMFKFTYRPNELFEATDTERIIALKKQLLFHRHNLNRSIFHSSVAMISGITLAVIIPIISTICQSR